VDAAVLLGLEFPVGNQGETRVSDCNKRDRNGQAALQFVFGLTVGRFVRAMVTFNSNNKEVKEAPKRGRGKLQRCTKTAIFVDPTHRIEFERT
jgi:hypothetical protein